MYTCTHINVSASFYFRFDFVVIAITFPAQLLEINHHHFVFLVPLRFVRYVYLCKYLVCVVMYVATHCNMERNMHRTS